MKTKLLFCISLGVYNLALNQEMVNISLSLELITRDQYAERDLNTTMIVNFKCPVISDNNKQKISHEHIYKEVEKAVKKRFPKMYVDYIFWNYGDEITYESAFLKKTSSAITHLALNKKNIYNLETTCRIWEFKKKAFSIENIKQSKEDEGTVSFDLLEMQFHDSNEIQETYKISYNKNKIIKKFGGTFVMNNKNFIIYRCIAEEFLNNLLRHSRWEYFVNANPEQFFDKEDSLKEVSLIMVYYDEKEGEKLKVEQKRLKKISRFKAMHSITRDFVVIFMFLGHISRFVNLKGSAEPISLYEIVGLSFILPACIQVCISIKRSTKH